MRRNIVMIGLLVMSFMTANARTFLHPGSTLSREELSTLKAHVENKDGFFYTLWKNFLADARCQSTWTAHNPVSDPGGDNRPRSSKDGVAAQYNAIIWQVTGETAHADAAVKTLMGWCNTIETAQNQLYQYPCRDMILAAELLRYTDGSFYEGWSHDDVTKFLDMVSTIFVPALRYARTNGMSSWSAGAIDGLLAAGVLLDDQSIYEEALGYYSDTDIPGSIAACSLETGQTKEMGRDNVHAFLTLDDLARMAQIAWSQGDDLYSVLDHRLLKAYDYWCRYNSGHEDTYYEPWGKWYYISTKDNAFRLHQDASNFESVHHHYKERLGMSEDKYPYLAIFAKLTRPEKEYQTLFFAESLETSPVFTTAPNQPTGVKAEGNIGCVYLSWDHPVSEDARGFYIYRSTNNKSFSKIKEWDFYTNNKYKDESVEPGTTYYYKVALKNYAGLSKMSTVVSAVVDSGSTTLPNGWSVKNIGTDVGTALYSSTCNGTFAVQGTGKDVGVSGDSYTFAYHKLQGDGSLVVRVTSTDISFRRTGIMVRQDLTTTSKSIGLGLCDSDRRYCYNFLRNTKGGQFTWTKGCDFTYAPCWFKLERKGNVFTTYQSRDGVNWFAVVENKCYMTQTVYIGMFTCTGSTTGDTYQAVFDNVSITDKTTGISSTQIDENVKAQSSNIYDLSGRVVAKNQQCDMVTANLNKGIYIMNGKKIIVK
jgi:regulation of enolase protein 1 (concanavalin A-like superfamily)